MDVLIIFINGENVFIGGHFGGLNNGGNGYRFFHKWPMMNFLVVDENGFMGDLFNCAFIIFIIGAGCDYVYVQIVINFGNWENVQFSEYFLVVF